MAYWRKSGERCPTPLMRRTRALRVRGHRTTIVIEAGIWDALDAAAAEMGMVTSELAECICADARTTGEHMNQALRLWAVSYYRDKWVREG